MIERQIRLWCDDRLFSSRRRWRSVRWLPWGLLALWLMSVATSGLRGPG